MYNHSMVKLISKLTDKSNIIMKSKIMTVEEAIDLIRDGDTVGVTGAGMRGYPYGNCL